MESKEQHLMSYTTLGMVLAALLVLTGITVGVSYFNLGRLYIDWARWDKAEKASRLALRLSPGFVEARKLLNYALKKQGKDPEPGA